MFSDQFFAEYVSVLGKSLKISWKCLGKLLTRLKKLKNFHIFFGEIFLNASVGFFMRFGWISVLVILASFFFNGHHEFVIFVRTPGGIEKKSSISR